MISHKRFPRKKVNNELYIGKESFGGKVKHRLDRGQSGFGKSSRLL
jgi:hypothetical protein